MENNQAQTGLKVYEAIANVMQKMSVEGISKGRRNQQQGYAFRGIDDVFNALSPLLAENKLCIMPRVLSRSYVERQTARGGALFYTVLDVEFDFVSALDGSKHTVRMMGEAMDSGDKSTNKAMSSAYKYACLQVFCIPTEGDNDADYSTHEIAPQNNNQPQSAQGQPNYQQQGQQKQQPNPELEALMRTFVGASKLGTEAFHKIWQQNPGPLRAQIKADQKRMDILNRNCVEADTRLANQQQGAAHA